MGLWGALSNFYPTCFKFLPISFIFFILGFRGIQKSDGEKMGDFMWDAPDGKIYYHLASRETVVWPEEVGDLVQPCFDHLGSRGVK